MSFDGQVLCQRMLMGPCALTMAGAATEAAALAAAVFRKRRRVEVLSFGAVMVSPRLTPVLLNESAVIYCPQHKGLRDGLATMIATMRRLDAGKCGCKK